MKLIDQHVPVFFRRRRNATLIAAALIGTQGVAGLLECKPALYACAAALVVELIVVLFSEPVF